MRLKDVEPILERANTILMEEPYIKFWGEYELYQMLTHAPTVKVIPIEEVARMLYKVTGTDPCVALAMPGIEDVDKWCGENCVVDRETSVMDCWIHAIKEGWLDAE